MILLSVQRKKYTLIVRKMVWKIPSLYVIIFNVIQRIATIKETE